MRLQDSNLGESLGGSMENLSLSFMLNVERYDVNQAPRDNLDFSQTPQGENNFVYGDSANIV